ncbi:tuberin [Trichonephila inaurata madagascariensis]|uniref:Tuberin n=1 Tax=Trichonephila inaurata madagascariensis TaxID=2747483 RepID=A0A8X7C411_9ARAC|nr:tuberin [Trichonephila inaurata madagascariensis]
MSKKEKSLHEKVKNFFGRRDTTPINFEGLRAVPYIVTPEVFKDISSENNVSHRIRSLKDLYEHVYTKKLAEFHVEAICVHIQDLLNVNQSTETRHIVFQFYCGLIHGQLGNLTIMRSYFFKLILLHNLPDDLMPRFDMLKALSDNGKTITNFEEEMGPFLLSLFLDFVAVGKEADLLALFTNVIKFNAAYLDDNVIEGFVKQIKNLCSRSKKDEDVQESLNVFEAILCYSHLPKTALHPFICTLCVTVNLENFVPCSWKQMRNLMGTFAGHSVIFHLCKMLQDLTGHPDPKIIRGAVYFISMALWGPNKVLTLKVPPTAIMPSFLRAIDRNDKCIAYEVISALNKLVSESGDQLEYGLVWDAILDVIGRILNSEFHAATLSCNKALQDFITLAERHCPEDSHERLYKIIDQCSEFRNEQSIKQLILYKEKKLHGFNSDFFTIFGELIEKFFRNESRPAIQLEVLKIIQRVRPSSFYYFEDDSIDQIILQHISIAITVPDVSVRKEAVKLVITMAESKSGHCFYEIMEIIEKIMKRMIECLKLDDSSVDSCSDVVAAAEGLISIFKKKLFDFYPHHCIEVFNLLVHHMQQQYQNLQYGEELIKIRKMAGKYFIKTAEYFIISEASYQVILTCLKEEKDWNILEMVLRELPILLRNKVLILCGKCSVNALCSILYNMIHDNKSGIPGILKNAPPRLTRTDVHCHIFPCVAALTSYHSCIDSHIQRLLNHCLQSGLVSRSAKICMEGLTLCLLEMQNSMLKLLPEMLLKLSKISATKIVAVPVLEFLSNLIRLPHLYVSFVEDQYMSIFAIALPYTNPFKFNQYTVALAHHVLSMWFLKCRIPFRRDFAKFIAKGLRSNLNVPRELPTQKEVDNSSNEMSTDAILNLHTELMETGLDLMARFTFGMCTNVPQRSPIAEFLLEKGQKSSWLVGNKIVTITTSGCGTKSFKHGLCENCYTSSHEMTKSLETVEPNFMEPDTFDSRPAKFTSQRKRHCSAIQRTNTAFSKEILSNANKSKDDITLHYKRNTDLDYYRSHDSHEPDAEFTNVNSNTESKEKEKVNHLCSCWCTSWAEVHIRRPTGSTSWMMRIQNQLFLPSAPPEVPLSVLSSLILPQQVVEEEEESEGGGLPSSESDILSLIESEKELSCEGAIEITSSQKSNASMRRTNSSPDMNTGWLQQSLEAETKYPASEESVIQDRDQTELKQPSEKLSRKQDPVERVKPKNLKLNLSSINKDRSYSVRSALSANIDTSDPVPFEQRLYKHEVQQSATGSFRDRGHTISVMSPSRPTGSENSVKAPEVSHRSGMSPSFVFLQLFHNSSFGPATQKPLLLQQTEANNRALSVLDHIPPYDTHKIGVVYVDRGQADNEVAILSNNFGSARYVAFLKGLGTMVNLCDIDPKKTYLGGLETNGEDGKLGLIWHDDVMQVVFHVATFMRNKESDEMRNEKKKHVANDSVMIVYNESEKDFEVSTIKGRVTNAWIIIQPEDYDCNIVLVKHRSEELVDMFGHTESYLVSDRSLPVFVRQMALHANLASLIISRNQQSSPKFAQVSNWLERLRAIKRLRSKVLEDLKKKNENFEFESPYDANDYDDFTDYV